MIGLAVILIGVVAIVAQNRPRLHEPKRSGPSRTAASTADSSDAPAGDRPTSVVIDSDWDRFRLRAESEYLRLARAGDPAAIKGPLFSVSPISLRRRLACLWENKRVITRLESPAAGTILIIEVGATCVGSIHQTYTPGSEVPKGAEKGYFAFGGSSVITLFEPGRIQLAADLLDWSSQSTELYARMGTPAGRAR